MATWLGITILVLFTLGLNVFMRLNPAEEPELPKNLGQWQSVEPQLASMFLQDTEFQLSEGQTLERRAWLYSGGLLRKGRLVEQRRIRRDSDGKVVQVLPERRLQVDVAG